MGEREDIAFINEWTVRWIKEGVYPFMGKYVKKGLARLEAEGFTKKEAEYWLVALTVLMTYRYGIPVPPAPYVAEIEKPKVYTEYEIMAMLAAGETIPATEYTGFEGTH